jgi:hypothetical protein
MGTWDAATAKKYLAIVVVVIVGIQVLRYHPVAGIPVMVGGAFVIATYMTPGHNSGRQDEEPWTDATQRMVLQDSRRRYGTWDKDRYWAQVLPIYHQYKQQGMGHNAAMQSAVRDLPDDHPQP